MLFRSQTICGRLTDCKPILTKKGHIVWYMTNDGSPVFYDVEPARLDDICFDGKGYIPLSGTTMKLSQDTYTEINDGKSHAYKPDVEVYYKGEKLTLDKDYTLSYEDNYTQGTAYAVITGKGMFSGWNKTAFTILPAEENTWEMPNWWGTTKPTQTPSASAAPTSAPENTPAQLRQNQLKHHHRLLQNHLTIPRQPHRLRDHLQQQM